MMAKFLSSPTKRADIVAEFDTLMSGDVDVSNYVQLVVAAIIYLGVEKLESALRVLHPSDHLECVALRLQALLSIYIPQARLGQEGAQDHAEEGRGRTVGVVHIHSNKF